MPFQKLNLHPTIVATLKNKGYAAPTPIQSEAIPHLLEGKDLLGIAQTGTGKTAAFSLPMIDRLVKSGHKPRANQIRALILTPTRELATQIAENIEFYGKGLNLKHAVIFGGVSEFHQIKALKEGLDIVVATPGRLLDLMNQQHVRFSQIEFFVLDEADRMLDMGFINDVKKIIARLPEKKQSLLFSATMPEAISGLAHSILHNPVKIEITPQSTTVERINQKVFLVAKANKSALLLDVLSKPEVASALVFSRTKHGANKIVLYLEKYGVLVAAIHGNKSQAAREKALGGLRSGKIKVLVATDIAARGIDVSSISHVINYDIPNDPESYVHRIGRTARAGREGVAISFCDASENSYLREIEKSIRMKIAVDESHPFHGKTGMQAESEGLNNGRNFEGRKKSGEKKFGEKSSGEKRFGDRKLRGERFGDKKHGEKNFGEKKFGERKFDDRKSGERKFGDRKPREERFGERKFGDRKPREENFGARKSGERNYRPKRDGEGFGGKDRSILSSQDRFSAEGEKVRNKFSSHSSFGGENKNSNSEKRDYAKKKPRKFGFGKFGKKFGGKSDKSFR